jgi:hypothetical protein
VSDLDLGIGRPRNAYRNRLIAQIAKDEGLPLPDASIMRDSVFPPPHRASFRAAVVAWLRRTARRQQAQARLERIYEHVGAREDADRALHARFADLRVHGEWFRGVDPLLSFIEGLKAVA